MPLTENNVKAELSYAYLHLPEGPSLWLVHTADGLLARRCAYGIGLRGAPESQNETSRTVDVPAANVFSVEGLRAVLTRASRDEPIGYEP